MMKKELGQSQANQFLNRSGGNPSQTQSSQGNVASPNLPQLIQIKNWVAQLNSKKMLRAQRNDIMNIVQQLGSEGNQYLLECLLESLDMSNAQNKANLHTTVKGQFLSQHLHDLIYSNTLSNFVDFLPQVFIKVICGPNSFTNVMNANKLNQVANYVQELSKCLKITIVDQLFIVLSLAYSNNEVVASDGVKMLKEKISDYLQQSNPQPLPQNNLPALLLQFVLQNQELKNMNQEVQQLKQLVIDSKNKEIKPLVYGKDNHDDEGNSQESDDIQDPDIHKEITYSKPEDFSNLVGPASILKDLGPSVTQSMENLIQIQQQFPKWTNSDIYICFEVMAQDPSTFGDEASQRLANNIYQVEAKNNQQEWSSFTNQEQSEKNAQNDWNVELFIEFINKKIFPSNNELNWQSVLLEIDRPEMRLKEEKAFKQFFLNMLLVNKKSPFQMPSNLILKPWKNIRSQAAFLKSMFSLGQLELVRWNEISKTPMNLEFNPSYKYNTLQPPSFQFWACLDILELLCEISEGDNYMSIHDLFENPIAKCPDILIVALSQLHPKKGANLLDEVFSQLFPNYLSNHINSVAILEAIWKNRDDLLISAISELYRKENKKENTSLNLSRVLDISQYLKDSLIALTNCNNYAFSVSLGILAGKREFLHFDQWLNERVKTVGDPFVNALLAYVEDNVINPIKEIQTRANNSNQVQNQYEGVLEKAQLTIEILTIIFESLLLEQSPEKLSNKNRQKLQEQYKEILQFFPQLSGASDSPGQITEKKANYNFQKFYTREINIEEMIANLKQLMNSNNSEDREVFACMITSLIEEAKYHVQYPVAELLLTGQLQGSIINSGLVNQKPLGIMLEQILESSRKTQRQVEQAVKAIESMRDRLHEFPNFVNALFESSNLSEYFPQFLLNIYNLMNERKIQINVTSKQIEYLKQKSEQLKNEANRPQQQQINPQQVQS